MSRERPLLLLSGLPLDRKPSFFRQLDFLAAALRERGRRVLLGGPVFQDSGSQGGPGAWSRAGAPEARWALAGSDRDPLRFAEVLNRTDPQGVIALGYPDQFPFLHGPLQAILPPCYLWSQFSRSPKGELPRTATYVPLTDKTASHLHAAGCAGIGPVIPHGVDARVFAPLTGPELECLKDGYAGAGTFVVGTVANNSMRKRLDLIVRSYALFARRHHCSRLLIKTDRSVSRDGVDLPALIAREKMEDRAEIILTELTEPGMVELYNRMDLYLNLSEWEGFCIPVVEAMACCVPVVSPPIQGPGEVIPYTDGLVPGGLIREDGETPLYQADPRAVCRVLMTLAEDGALRSRLSKRGRTAVLSRYEIRRVAAQWERLLSVL